MSPEKLQPHNEPLNATKTAKKAQIDKNKKDNQKKVKTKCNVKPQTENQNIIGKVASIRK